MEWLIRLIGRAIDWVEGKANSPARPTTIPPPRPPRWLDEDTPKLDIKPIQFDGDTPAETPRAKRRKSN